MNILAEARDPDFSPGELALPYQPWLGDSERRGRGFSKPWPGSRSRGSFGSARFMPMSEYVYANGGILERLDFDPELGYGMGKVDVEYYAQDILGSVMMMTGPHGRIRERYEYDSYGQAFEGSFRRINELGYSRTICTCLSDREREWPRSASDDRRCSTRPDTRLCGYCTCFPYR